MNLQALANLLEDFSHAQKLHALHVFFTRTIAVIEVAGMARNLLAKGEMAGRCVIVRRHIWEPDIFLAGPEDADSRRSYRCGNVHRSAVIGGIDAQVGKYCGKLPQWHYIKENCITH